MKEITKNKIDKAYKEGKIYKVKEILEGNIRSQPYDKELYEEYGKLLYKLGDLKNAGKYLLLADNNEKKYKKAISLFLNSYSPDQWWYLFPQKLKKLPIDKLPKSLKRLMEEHPDFKISVIRYKTQNNIYYQFKENKKETIAMFIAGAFFILIILLGIIKFADIILYLVKFVFDKYFIK